MRTEELRPYSQKSYYGKALIKYKDNGTIILQSYDTDVCKIENGNLIRLWGGYSATTMKHINDFIREFGIVGGGKKWWESLPCGKYINQTPKYRVVLYNVVGAEPHKSGAVFDSYEQAYKEYERITENLNPFWYAEIEEV